MKLVRAGIVDQLPNFPIAETKSAQSDPEAIGMGFCRCISERKQFVYSIRLGPLWSMLRRGVVRAPITNSYYLVSAYGCLHRQSTYTTILDEIVRAKERRTASLKLNDSSRTYASLLSSTCKISQIIAIIWRSKSPSPLTWNTHTHIQCSWHWLDKLFINSILSTRRSP